MRCDNCDFCTYDRADDMYECSLCLDCLENSKGKCGCKYNRKTLKKIEAKYWEEERNWTKTLCEWTFGENK